MDHSLTMPCSQGVVWVHLFIALGVILNTALATWLAHRRYRQDRYNRSPERQAFEMWRRYVRSPDDRDDDARSRNSEEP